MNVGFYVYVHKRKSDAAVFYVGKGRGDRAWSNHHRNPHWWATVKKHGVDVHVESTWDNEIEAFDRERELISLHRAHGAPLCNMTDGGEGGGTYIRTEETRRKYSAIHKGKTVSEETRRKISESKRGKKVGPPSESARANMSAAQKGRIITDEARAKISAALTGRQWSASRPRIMSEEQRAKLSDLKRGKPWTAARRAAMRKGD